MDLYVLSLGLGAVGLGAMGIGGLAQHLGSHAGSHAADPAPQGAPGQAAGASLATSGGLGAAASVTHGGLGAAPSHAHGSAGPAHSHGTAPADALAQVSTAHAHGNTAHAHGSAAHAHGGAASFTGWLASFLSPRVAFGVLLGLGTAGVLLQQRAPEPFRFALALAAGLAFDRWLLTPLWNLSLRFASRPALTLETAVAGEAKAVTAFDAEGHGIVQIDLDGQLVQVLATLSRKDRALGHRVRPGEALRVEDVDPKRNRCSVTLL